MIVILMIDPGDGELGIDGVGIHRGGPALRIDVVAGEEAPSKHVV